MDSALLLSSLGFVGGLLTCEHAWPLRSRRFRACNMFETNLMVDKTDWLSPFLRNISLDLGGQSWKYVSGNPSLGGKNIRGYYEVP